MIPAQTLADPAMAVVVLSVVLILVVIFGFVWAFRKIAASSEHGEESGTGQHSA